METGTKSRFHYLCITVRLTLPSMHDVIMTCPMEDYPVMKSHKNTKTKNVFFSKTKLVHSPQPPPKFKAGLL